MIRVLVLSDSHGSTYAVESAVETYPDAQYIIHLGDGANDMETTVYTTDATVYQVRGNCDGFCSFPDILEERIGGIPFLITHGNEYGVKFSLGKLEAEARRRAVRIALFGHTHSPLCEYRDGLYLINPGSLRFGDTYAVIDIVGNSIAPRIVEMR